MKNNFDLKGYMKENKVGSYQQLNEMWYQDINQALGDFNVIKEEEMQADTMPVKVSLDYADYPSISDSEQKMAINQFMKLVKSLGGNATKTADKFSTIDFEITGGPSFEELQAAYDKQGEDMFASVLASWKLNKSELEEMGGVKNIGDKAKMATPNTRPNLGRHRSSDTLDKQVAKDHDKKTVTGAKAAAYKAPHMKESEFNTVGKDLTLNDVNKDTVITPFELEKTWKDVYGEDFKTKYSGAYSYLTKNYKNFTIVDLGDVWERMYGEDFLQEYPGISRWLFSNQGKTSSKDKVAPKMNEEETDDIFAGSDTADWNGKAERMDWEKDLVGKEVGNWKSDIEQQAGSISWTSEKYPNAIIYATPGWEGVDGIAVEVHESEDGYLDEPKLQKVVAAGTDLWKTKEGYLALMAKIFTTLEKMLTPAEMTEDHGTQINHDMNDDISTDHTEPEHMVQNEGIEDWNHTWEEDIVDLLDDGVSKPQILTYFTDILKIARTSMEESIEEDEDPYGSIKGGIDKITMGDDDMDMGDDDRMMSLGGDRIKAGIESLMADGFDYREILQFVKDTIAAKRNF